MLCWWCLHTVARSLHGIVSQRSAVSYIKQKYLPNLDFRGLMQTQDGIEFDLRDLAD
ncbi:MAG: hypothetical protein FWG65_00880 [Turicibacter sp.]|nr:hypothetical protein [Turicibacter sp.]